MPGEQEHGQDGVADEHIHVIERSGQRGTGGSSIGGIVAAVVENHTQRTQLQTNIEQVPHQPVAGGHEFP